MATRSTVWFYDKDTDSIKGTYIHWDGYLRGVGLTLLYHYSDIDKLRELTKHQVSSLEDTVKNSEMFKNKYDTWTIKNVSKKLKGSVNILTVQDLIRDSFNVEEYLYLYINNQWYGNWYNLTYFRELRELRFNQRT